MNDPESVIRGDLILCKSCLRYIGPNEKLCPFCEQPPTKQSSKYVSLGLEKTSLLWKVEKAIERYELAEFLKNAEQEHPADAPKARAADA